MTSNGGADHGVGNDTDTDLDEVVAGLRGGDLSFVFTLATRLGARIAAQAACGPLGADPFVHAVALELAALAAAPERAGTAADALLAEAIERACLTPGAEWVSAAGTCRRPDERSA